MVILGRGCGMIFCSPTRIRVLMSSGALQVGADARRAAVVLAVEDEHHRHVVYGGVPGPPTRRR